MVDAPSWNFATVVNIIIQCCQESYELFNSSGRKSVVTMAHTSCYSLDACEWIVSKVCAPCSPALMNKELHCLHVPAFMAWHTFEKVCYIQKANSAIV